MKTLILLTALATQACAGLFVGLATAASAGMSVASAAASTKKIAHNIEIELKTPAPSSPACIPAVCFSPKAYCDVVVMRVIDAATKTLDVAVYGLNDPTLVEALLAARARGVALRVLVDRTQLGLSKMHAQVGRLLDSGIVVKRQHHVGVMHDKFAVADGAIVETGSFNWTTRAVDYNDENLLVLCDAALAAQYAERFESMWVDDVEVTL